MIVIAIDSAVNLLSSKVVTEFFKNIIKNDEKYLTGIENVGDRQCR